MQTHYFFILVQVHSRFFFHMDYWNITNQMEYGEVGALYPSHHRW